MLRRLYTDTDLFKPPLPDERRPYVACDADPGNLKVYGVRRCGDNGVVCSPPPGGFAVSNERSNYATASASATGSGFTFSFRAPGRRPLHAADPRFLGRLTGFAY